MSTSELRQRVQAPTGSPSGDLASSENPSGHPSGKAKRGQVVAYLRAIACGFYFFTGCLVIHATQILGSPLYFINRELYYAYMSLTKQSFGLLITTLTHWWAPTVIRISGDASVASQLSYTPDGRVECAFPERLVLIANHQIYTDWLYLWWVAYTNAPRMHGHIYILLKESLKYIPILGPGCMYLSFIFMSRKMENDKPRLAHRLGKLKSKHTAPSGKSYFDPMWLLLFPEGTNMSQNGRNKSAAWAAKTGVKDMEHLLLPRSTGLFYCLNELRGTVDYVYDCAVAYEGIPRGKFGEDFFTLSSTFFHGRPPKSINFYWRRYAVAEIPLDDQAAFETWLRDRWYEKDALMERYLSTGRFPANAAGIKGHIETQVRTQYWWEFINIYLVLGAIGMVFHLAYRFYTRLAGAL